MLNEIAVKIAVKIIKQFEGCNLIAYPDPASDLYKKLSANNMLAKYMRGDVKFAQLPINFQALSGAPWTIGYGETKGVTRNSIWTQSQADSALDYRTREFMERALKDCPKLATESPERIAAITSLCYNIGSAAFANSTACKRIMAQDDNNVPEAIKRYNIANGRVNDGLINRRQMECNLWNSGS